MKCFLDINECASTPCLNGGVCNNEVGKYSCDCTNAVGYVGKNCERGMAISFNCSCEDCHRWRAFRPRHRDFRVLSS